MIRNIGRVDRITADVRPENLESVVAALSFGLQTSFWGPCDLPGPGGRIAVSWDGGIELVAPAPGGSRHEALDRLGERWVGVKVGVRDLDATCERLARLGVEPTERWSLVTGSEPWCERFSRIDEASFDDEFFGGLPIVLCTVEERDAARAAAPGVANVDRIDHVTALVRPENLEALTATLSFALQTAFYGPFAQPDIGSRLSVSWDAGVELITPLDPEPDDRRLASLDAGGERWVSLIYGVRDLDATIERLRRLGHEPTMRFDGPAPFDPWHDRFQRFQEAGFRTALFGGLPIVFSTIQPHPPSGS